MASQQNSSYVDESLHAGATLYNLAVLQNRLQITLLHLHQIAQLHSGMDLLHLHPFVENANHLQLNLR